MLRDDKGITLIEIVLIIVILGIVAAVALIQFGNIFNDAKDASLQGGFGYVNTQLIIAVNKLKGLPTAPNGNPPGGTFRREVYNNLEFSSGLSKASISCDGTDCTFELRTNNCAGSGAERKITVTYNGPTNLGSPGRLSITAGPETC